MEILSVKFLDEIEDELNLSFKKKSDLVLIIKAYSLQDDVSGFENLCFNGKYLNGLFRVLKESANLPEVKNVDHIKKDIGENIEKMFSQLRNINLNLDEQEKNQLQNDYLQLSQNSLQNLQALVEDLDHIKKYLNILKRKNSN
ncbi:MAG TPA: hypothetical protein PKD67_05605 [Ignavibacteriaceae bacterium]|nr:hypothetical protein [Ignavibacteriaceae bacterium]